MTFTPEKDLANHIRFIAEYENGSSDVMSFTASPWFGPFCGDLF